MLRPLPELSTGLFAVHHLQGGGTLKRAVLEPGSLHTVAQASARLDQPQVSLDMVQEGIPGSGHDRVTITPTGASANQSASLVTKGSANEMEQRRLGAQLR